MRALVYQNMSWGGHHKYGMCLSQALAEQGVEVDLVTSRRSGAQSPDYQVHRVLHPMYAELWYLGARPVRYADRYLRHWLNFRIMAKLAVSQPFDVVHLQVLEAWPNLRALLWLCHRRPVVLTVHNVEEHWLAEQPRGLADWLRRAAYRLERSRLRRARNAVSLCIVHTQSAATALQGVSSVDPRRVRVIPFGPHEEASSCYISGDSVDAFRAELGISANDRVALFFGEIRRNKGLSILLDAWPDVLSLCPQAKLLIAGYPRDPSGFQRYAEQISSLGIGSRVCTLLKRLSEEELELVYAVSHLSVLPYLPSFLGQSGVLLTALAHGHPVVATDVGGLGELIRDTGAGVLVPSEARSALAAAVAQLLLDPDHCAELGSRALEAAQHRYTWARAAELTIHAYQEARRFFGS